MKHISKLLKITQWKEQDTSIYIPQMPFVKLCLLGQQKKGFLISFCISVFSEVEFFFHSIICLKKHSYPLWILFSIFFFLPTWVLFVTILFHQLCQYVNTVHIQIVTLCSTYEILHDFKIWEGTSLWEQQCEHTINLEAYSHKRMLNHQVLKRHVCYFLQSST